MRTKSDELALNVLTQLGFTVEAIPESQKKEADFLISYMGCTAIVEAKLKEDAPKNLASRKAILNSGEIYCSDHKLGSNGTMSGVIRKADEQLTSSADKAHHFKFMLHISDCINSAVVAKQFENTIYGSTEVIEYGESSTLKTCYFYRHSDFYRRRELDAAIVGYLIEEKVILTICLNPYSANYEALKESKFLLPFNQSVIDPIEEEAHGSAFVPDDNIDRTETDFSKSFPLYNPMLLHLAKKYKTKPLIKLDWESPEITARCRVGKYFLPTR